MFTLYLPSDVVLTFSWTLCSYQASCKQVQASVAGIKRKVHCDVMDLKKHLT